MASEITPGQKLLAVAVAVSSAVIDDEDSYGPVIEIKVPDDDGELCLLNPAYVFPVDDLREVLREALCPFWLSHTAQPPTGHPCPWCSARGALLAQLGSQG
jgi:hypothetical protein